MDQHTFDLTIREDPSKVIPTLGRKAQRAFLAGGASRCGHAFVFGCARMHS